MSGQSIWKLTITHPKRAGALSFSFTSLQTAKACAALFANEGFHAEVVPGGAGLWDSAEEAFVKGMDLFYPSYA